MGKSNIDSASASSAYGAFAITPSDTVNFLFQVRGIYVGAAGNVVIVTDDNEAITFVGCVAGSILPVRAKRVNSTSTTATSLVGLY